MDTAATVVWLAPLPADGERTRALANWARTHGVSLVEPTVESPPRLPGDAADPKIAAEVDDFVDRARDAVSAGDADGADRALAAAEARLRAHPELPHAAWLMAEVERCRSMRWRRLPPVDSEAADRAWQRAEALDGGRLPGIGEQASAGAPPTATLDLGSSLAPREQAWLDGSPVRGSVPTRAGLHALAVTWDGSPIWAAWVDVPAGASSVAMDVPPPPACSAADFGGVRVEGTSVAADRVRCRSWVAVTAAARSAAVRVSTCEGNRCGPLLDWQAPEPWTLVPPPEHRDRNRWPAWATWGLVGAGAAVATGAVIILATALRPAPTETVFTLSNPSLIKGH
jgi:hypothetical protein